METTATLTCPVCDIQCPPQQAAGGDATDRDYTPAHP